MPPPFPSPIRRRARRGCLAAAIILAALLALPIGILSCLRTFHSPWPAPPEGVRLEIRLPLVPRPELTEADAQYHLLACTHDYHHVDGLHEDRTRWGALGRLGAPYPAMAEAAQTNAVWHEHIARAARAPSNGWHFTMATDETLPWLSPCLNWFRLCGWQAWTDEQSVGPDAADEHRIAALQLASRFVEQGALIQHLIGLAGIGMICDDMARAAMDDPAPSPARLKNWIRILHEFEPAPDSFAETLRYEYLFASNAVHEVYSSAEARSEILPTGRLLRSRPSLLRLAGSSLPRTQRHVADTYRHLITLAQSPAGPAPAEDWFESHFVRNRMRFMLDDPIGALTLSLVVPATDRARDRHLDLVTAMRATRLICAIRIHELEHNGRLPDRLSDLVPGVLDELPADPFHPDEAPFEYRLCPQDGYVLWSVNRDGRDDGGSATLDPPSQAADLVFGPVLFRLRREAYFEKEIPRKNSSPLSSPS